MREPVKQAYEGNPEALTTTLTDPNNLARFELSPPLQGFKVKTTELISKISAEGSRKSTDFLPETLKFISLMQEVCFGESSVKKLILSAKLLKISKVGAMRVLSAIMRDKNLSMELKNSIRDEIVRARTVAISRELLGLGK